jgi:glycosyltransferase involved in cell wall biosynthesis
VADRVTLTGILPPAHVVPFLLSGRVGVCPLKRGVDSVSDKFTSPMKLLQMMSLGMPIVASDMEPVRALVTAGQEALLVPPNDPRALAAAIGRLLDRPEEATRLGAMAQHRAEAFTWAQRARKLEGFLQALLQTRRAA